MSVHACICILARSRGQTLLVERVALMVFTNIY